MAEDTKTENRIAELAGLIAESVLFLNGRQLDPQQAERQAFAWFNQLRGIPTPSLRACYEAWQDSGPRQSLRALDLVEAWRVQREERQRKERERENVVQIGTDTVSCWHCNGQGYQPVWRFKHGHWSSAMRGCQCEAAPFAQREQSALSTELYERHPLLVEYALRADLREHGAPNRNWCEIVNALNAPVDVPVEPAKVFSIEGGKPLPF